MKNQMKNLVLIVSILSIIGPALFLLTAMLGGDPIDGFAGAPLYNEDWQNNLFQLSVGMTIVSVLLNLIITIKATMKFVRNDKRYIFLSVLGVVLPIALFIISLYISADLASDRQFLTD